MLINFSNHPSSDWQEKQKKAANAYGRISDIPFPQVDPYASTDEVVRLAEEYTLLIAGKKPSAVFVAGDFALVYSVVKRLKALGFLVLSACTERKAIEFTDPDGTRRKNVIFDFVQFREFE